MRVVLDTNVLWAAFVVQVKCDDLLEHCQREHHLVTSPFILQEFEKKLKGKFRIPADKASAPSSLLRNSVELVTPAPLHPHVCRVDCILTGDKDLLSLGSFDGMPILLPLDRSEG